MKRRRRIGFVDDTQKMYDAIVIIAQKITGKMCKKSHINKKIKKIRK